MAKRFTFIRKVFRVLFRVLGILLGIIFKVTLFGFFIVSKLFEIGLVHINRAAEMVLTGKVKNHNYA